MGIESAIIAMAVVMFVMMLGLGLVIGYLVRAYIHDTTPQYTHPECYDEHGNPIADSVIVFRFEGEAPRLPDDFDD